MVSPPPPGPVVARRHRLAGDLDPADAVRLVAGDAHPVALCGEWADATAIVASEPTTLLGEVGAAAVAEALAVQPQLATGSDADVAVGGGWLGFLGYPTCAAIAGGPPPPPRRDRLTDHALGFYDHALVRDGDGTWWFEELWTAPRAAELARRRDELGARLDRLAGSAPAPGAASWAGPWVPEPSPAGHAHAVEACRERIAHGDLFQANLALRLRSRLDGDPAALFAAGVARLGPQRAAFCGGPWGTLVSLSPELLVRRRGRDVITAPIKGTRPRPLHDDAEATRLRDELAASEKDRAENTMIVDLMRNDLGRVCEPGSVIADPICEVRPMAGVWHLVSEVRGRLREDCGDDALAAALLPAGSVTGAPKHAALAVIAELESSARQAFCGSAVLASPLGRCELSVLIRSFECAPDGRLWLDVGGGITAGSNGADEARECLEKARPLLALLGGEPPEDAIGAHHVETAGPRPLRVGPRPLPRPDPAAGIFTTIRVEGGTPQHLDLHVDRLERSAVELTGPIDAEAVAALARLVAGEHGGDCLMRLIVDGDGTARAEVAEVPPVPEFIDLAAVCVPGGIGAHKWRDRTLLEALERRTAPAQPLLVDLDGFVLETSRWTVFAQVGGELVTPPLDGRVLPGVLRATLLAGDTPVRERALTLAELTSAESVVVANALRGIVPVRSVTRAP